MNIIIDKATHLELQRYLIDTIEFGSGMKGTSDVNSDHDYLHIIGTSHSWLMAPYNTHHLLQYKGEDGDHIYCNPHTFVKSLLDGDSTIFHEMLMYKAVAGTCLEALAQYKFEHYKTYRAYLGIARRDLKEATKIFNKDKRKAQKKFKFAVQAYNYVNGLMGDAKPLKFTPCDTVQEMHKDCTEVQSLVEDLRVELNAQFNAGNIARSVSNAELEELESFLGLCELLDYDTGLSYFRESFQQGN